MNTFYCADCQTNRELDIHGRCPCCGGEAVAVFVYPGEILVPTGKVLLEALESLVLR